MRRFRTKTTSSDVEPAETVAIQSGGPDMTVMDADPEAGNVRCWWIDSDCLAFRTFGDNPVWPKHFAEP